MCENTVIPNTIKLPTITIMPCTISFRTTLLIPPYAIVANTTTLKPTTAVTKPISVNVEINFPTPISTARQ